MILISFTLALIAIVFGAKLLAQSQKESLGALYKYLSWFIMIMGFLVLLCDGARALMRCCHRGDGMMSRECIMIDGGGMMRGGGMYMYHNHCGMNNEGNCCGGMMNCDDKNSSSNGMGGNGSCSDGMKCKEGKEAGSCTMGGMKCKMDSTKTDKK